MAKKSNTEKNPLKIKRTFSNQIVAKKVQATYQPKVFGPLSIHLSLKYTYMCMYADWDTSFVSEWILILGNIFLKPQCSMKGCSKPFIIFYV